MNFICGVTNKIATIKQNFFDLYGNNFNVSMAMFSSLTCLMELSDRESIISDEVNIQSLFPTGVSCL